MLINEIYKSIQGEGKFIGTPSIFIRLSGCNLSCSWCDTKYTWLFTEKKLRKVQNRIMRSGQLLSDFKGLKIHNKSKEETKMYPLKIIGAIMELLDHTNIRNVVFTGGEPLIQTQELEVVIQCILDLKYGIKFEIETNGTIPPSDKLVELADKGLIHFNVSPKTDNSDNKFEFIYKPLMLQRFRNTNSIFKFVIKYPLDVSEVSKIIKEIEIPKEWVYLMSEGNTPEQQLGYSEIMIEMCEKYGFNYSPRLHVLLWGNKRGV